MPTDQSDQAAWVKQLWNSPGLLVDSNNGASNQWGTYDYTTAPGQNGPVTPPPFSPNLRYTYDSYYRRMVRVKLVPPYTTPGPSGSQIVHDEEVAWVAPTGASGGIRSLGAIQTEAAANNSYVQTLPLLPKLPASAVLYEGSAF
jgi:hypothetical protein